MKRILQLLVILSCLTTTLYSQNTNKEGMKRFEQIRKEMKAEEKAKEDAIKKEKKAKEVALKKQKERVKAIRRDMNESLEEKVFRSENTPVARKEAIATAFKVGKERMYFLKLEEEEINKFEKELGIEKAEDKNFLNEKFDEIHAKFESATTESEFVAFENEKLREYLSKLNKMEEQIRLGEK
ncbi:MAG: hypothetical protein ACRCVS_01710 [Fusobacteriaceae bacterium]